MITSISPVYFFKRVGRDGFYFILVATSASEDVSCCEVSQEKNINSRVE
jgi:hypothetical protein